jgi:integration host factor subunit alpha
LLLNHSKGGLFMTDTTHTTTNISKTSNTLTKASLVEALISSKGLPKREARHLVDLFFEEISAELSAGNEVKLSGFGTFEVRHKALRTGRNPRTGEPFPIDARTVVAFLPSDKLRDKMNA